MRGSAALACAGLILLAACGGRPEPVTVYEPVKVKVPVPLPCPPPAVTPTEGPDLAPNDATIFEAAQYARARIVALRAEVRGLRAALESCVGGDE